MKNVRAAALFAAKGSNHIGVKDADWCATQVRFVKERGELWATCQGNGFMILKFTNGAWPFTN